MAPSPIRLGLIGDNIAASKAPDLHRIAGRLCGLEVTYDLLRPKDIGLPLEKVLGNCQRSGYRGVNITYPYKELVVGHVSVDDSTVQAIGACNTALFDAAQPHGFNTDFTGFIVAYRNTFGGTPPGSVTLVGAGGVGRAIGFALAQLGANTLRLFDLDRRKSIALSSAIRSAQTNMAIEIADSVEEAARGTDGLINSTPVGMVGIGGCPLPPDLIAGHRWAFDAVYTPVDTPFMFAARANGLSVMSGYELYFYQGVDAFRHFTGHDIATAPLREALQNSQDHVTA